VLRPKIAEVKGLYFSILNLILRKDLAMSEAIVPHVQFVPFSSDLWFSSRLLPWNPLVYCLVAAILAIAYWLVLELTFEVYFTFKRHDGLYFWSIIVSTWGVALRAIGWTVQMFMPGANPYLCTTFMITGVSAMVTGFSFVLYSRLHLVIRDRRVLRVILVAIAFDGVAFLLPLAVAQYGVNSHDPYNYVSLILPAERLYAIGYFLQEIILGCLYIWTARRTVLHSYVERKHKTTAVLIGAQILVILLDIPTLVLAWPSPSMGASIIILGTLHPTIYAIKLKIELVVLDQLVEIVRHGIRTGIPGRHAVECRNTSNRNKKGWMSPSSIKQIVISRVPWVGEKKAATQEGLSGS
jgi:hypothetical protein